MLEGEGQTVEPAAPDAVVRAAFEARLIVDGRGWLSAIRLPNGLSHVYKQEMFAEAIPAIVDQHLPVLSALPRELAASLSR